MIPIKFWLTSFNERQFYQEGIKGNLRLDLFPNGPGAQNESILDVRIIESPRHNGDTVFLFYIKTTLKAVPDISCAMVTSKALQTTINGVF